MDHDILAIVFLALVAASPLLWAIWRMARSQYSPVQCLMFGAAMLIVRLLWRAELPPPSALPRRQGAVIIGNHRSSIDPFFVQMCADRPTHWMVAKEYCTLPIVSWFLRRCEVIPTNRAGVDTAATKAAIRFASNGEIVGMFPEGRLNKTDQFMLPCRAGAILVALRAKVPVIPCYIEGSPRGESVATPFWTPARVRLRLGAPIDLSEYYDRDVDTATAQQLLIRCVKEIARLAGEPDFEPRLAGRRWNHRDELAEVIEASPVAPEHSGRSDHSSNVSGE
jgi:1-acyl-sn-glycerol-3-phosphate acyltransferase